MGGSLVISRKTFTSIIITTVIININIMAIDIHGNSKRSGRADVGIYLVRANSGMCLDFIYTAKLNKAVRGATSK